MRLRQPANADDIAGDRGLQQLDRRDRFGTEQATEILRSQIQQVGHGRVLARFRRRRNEVW